MCTGRRWPPTPDACPPAARWCTGERSDAGGGRSRSAPRGVGAAGGRARRGGGGHRALRAAGAAAQTQTVEVLPKEVDLDAVPPEVEAGLSEGQVTDFEDWRKIDAEEIRRGEAMGKERERMEWKEARSLLSRTSA